MVPKSVRICLLCFLLLAGWSRPGGAGDRADNLTGTPLADPLIAAVQIEEPWSSLGAGRPGILPELFSTLADRAGVGIQVRLMSHEKLLDSLREGEAELAIIPLDERARHAAVPLIRMGVMDIAAFPAKGVWLWRYGDFYDRRIAVRNGAHHHRFFDDDGDLIKLRTEGELEALNLLIDGRVDIVVGRKAVIRHHLGRLGYQRAPNQVFYILDSRQLWLQQSIHNNIPLPVLDRLLAAARMLSSDDVFRETVIRLLGSE